MKDYEKPLKGNFDERFAAAKRWYENANGQPVR